MANQDEYKEIKYLDSYQHSLLALLQETMACSPAEPVKDEADARKKVQEPA